MNAEPRRPTSSSGGRSAIGPGIVLGLGLGGFVDGIVLHQILQWHHMISSTDEGQLGTVSGLEANTLADGVFHAGAWLLTVAGVWWLWRNLSRHSVAPDRQFFGWLIVGWGVFNVVDEVVFHALLDLHHIREGDDELVYDMAFLGVGIAQLALGSLLARSGGPHAAGER